MFFKGIYKIICLLLIICLSVSCIKTDKYIIQNTIENNNQEINNKIIKSLAELMSEIYFNDYSLYEAYFEKIEEFEKSEWKIIEKMFLLYSNENIDESLINIDIELYPTSEEARKGMLLTCSLSAIKYEMNVGIGIGDTFAWYNEQHIIFSRANVVVGIGIYSDKSMVNIAKEIDQKLIDIIK